MLKGLYEIVPKDLLRIFSEKELELLISGLPEIDVDEWRANTGESLWLDSLVSQLADLSSFLQTFATSLRLTPSLATSGALSVALRTRREPRFVFFLRRLR